MITQKTESTFLFLLLLLGIATIAFFYSISQPLESLPVVSPPAPEVPPREAVEDDRAKTILPDLGSSSEKNITHRTSRIIVVTFFFLLWEKEGLLKAIFAIVLLRFFLLWKQAKKEKYELIKREGYAFLKKLEAKEKELKTYQRKGLVRLNDTILTHKVLSLCAL